MYVGRAGALFPSQSRSISCFVSDLDWRYMGIVYVVFSLAAKAESENNSRNISDTMW